MLIVVVTFVKINVNVKFCGPNVGKVLTYQVVTVSAIGLTAGAFAGTRTPSAARVTQMITMALITSCLFKTVLSRCWV